jgi:hypothetical protein
MSRSAALSATTICLPLKRRDAMDGEMKSPEIKNRVLADCAGIFFCNVPARAMSPHFVLSTAKT